MSYFHTVQQKNIIAIKITDKKVVHKNHASYSISL